MPVLPIIDVTDTHLQILDMRAFDSTPAQQDLLDWCTTHNLDPHVIPATAPIRVDRTANAITYERCVTAETYNGPTGEVVRGRLYGGEHGVVTETIRYQPEKPIGPWPDSVLELAAAHTVTDTPLQDALVEIERLRSQMEPGRWWRAIDERGGLWCESSDEDEVREAARPTDTVQRQFVTVPRTEWRDA